MDFIRALVFIVLKYLLLLNFVTGRVLLDCARNYNAPTAPKRLAQDIRAADIVA